MDNLKTKIVVLNLLDAMNAQGSWSGETHVQKTTYFLQQALKVPTNLRFILYKHGPYSFELHQILGEMKADMLIDMKLRPYPYGPSIVSTESGRMLSARFPKTADEVREAIEFAASSISTMNVSELEKIGTALYVSMEDNAPQDEYKLAQRIVELKPHVQHDEALEAIRKLRELLDSAPK